MNGKDLLCGMSLVDDKLVEEAETVMLNKHKSLHWRNFLATAACFVIVVVTAIFVPTLIDNPAPQPGYEQLPVHSTDPNPYQPNVSTGYQISMEDVVVNQMVNVIEASFAYNPALHDFSAWSSDDILSYYGKAVVPAYIPKNLEPSPYNEDATVLVDKSGVIVNDLIYFDFYHAYDEHGVPLMNEDNGAKTGFSMAVSKIGTIGDCTYADNDNLKTTTIGDTTVIIGKSNSPYEMYTVEFQNKDVHYLIVAEQMQLEEVIKVVASIIYESGNVSIKN